MVFHSAFDFKDHLEWSDLDPAAAHFTKTNYTDDTAWNDLDLSSLIPPDATHVILQLTLLDATANQWVGFKKKGQTNDVQVAFNHNQVANVEYNTEVTVPVNSSGIVSMKCSVKPTDWTAINITVLGWHRKWRA